MKKIINELFEVFYPDVEVPFYQKLAVIIFLIFTLTILILVL